MTKALNYDDRPSRTTWICEETVDGIIATWRPRKRMAWVFVAFAPVACAFLLSPFLILRFLGIDAQSLDRPPSPVGTSIMVGLVIILCAWMWAVFYFLNVRCRVSQWGVTLTTYIPPRARVRTWSLSEVERFVVEHRRRGPLDLKGRYYVELTLKSGRREPVMQSPAERVPIWLAAHLQRGLERAKATHAS